MKFWIRAVLLAAAVALLLGFPFLCSGRVDAKEVPSIQTAGRFDAYVSGRLEEAFAEERTVSAPTTERKFSYTLRDEDMVAPRPDVGGYGQSDDPQELARLLERASGLLEGQSCYFDPERPRKPGSTVSYYYDETILSLVWQEIHDECVYTFAEVKIGDGSQFRRFLAGGRYDSGQQLLTSEMAASVNAVLGSSADFYAYRYVGTSVYMGKVYRVDRGLLDTCMIDGNGNLIFEYAQDVMTPAEAQAFMDEHGIRFALSFGPILVDDGILRSDRRYGLGQPDEPYPRAALCQMDKLHYLVAAANYETDIGCTKTPTTWEFGAQIAQTGCRKAYALDGGQTAAIALGGQVMNTVSYGSQRKISDIIYFATALPEGE